MSFDLVVVYLLRVACFALLCFASPALSEVGVGGMVMGVGNGCGCGSGRYRSMGGMGMDMGMGGR